MSKNSIADILNCNDLNKFAKIIGVIRGFNGASNSRFFECGFEGRRFLMKLYFHIKTVIEIYNPAETKNSQPPANVEIKIMQLFKKQLIDANLTPCIVELLYTKTCEDVQFKKISEDIKLVADMINGWVDYHKKLVAAGLADPKYSFIAMEICDITLAEYLKKYVHSSLSFTILKSIIYHILYALYMIKLLFPSFRHHDLHSMNIMLWVDNNYVYCADRPQYLVYNGLGAPVSVPYFGIIPKIIDFGHSEIPDMNIHSTNLFDKDFLFVRGGDDISQFLHDIDTILKNEIIGKMLDEIDPSLSFLLNDKNKKGPPPSLEEMLKCAVFKDYSHKVSADWIYHEYSMPPKKTLKNN